MKEPVTKDELKLLVEAKLVDPGSPAPLPGIIHIVSLMQYKVLQIIRGQYAHSEIYVGHYLPNLDAPEFRPGVCHRLQLTQNFPDETSVLDKFQNAVSKSEQFFCTAFEVIE